MNEGVVDSDRSINKFGNLFGVHNSPTKKHFQPVLAEDTIASSYRHILR